MTPIIPPAVLEAAARAMFVKMAGPQYAGFEHRYRSWPECEELARAALDAIGYAEAAGIVRDLAEKVVLNDELLDVLDRARAWSHQYPKAP